VRSEGGRIGGRDGEVWREKPGRATQVPCRPVLWGAPG